MLANGNQLLERNFNQRFGRLEAGYTADLTICDYSAPTPLCAENLAGHFTFGINSSAVHSVMIAGKMVYEDREFGRETAHLYEEARRAAEKMWHRMAAL